MKASITGLLLMVMGTGLMQAQQTIQTLKLLNIDYKNRGYFYASSPQLESTRGFGGWADAEHYYQNTKPAHQFPDAKLSVIIRPQEQATFYEKFDGITLYVVNTTADTLFFEAQDSRLNMKMQAWHNGQWKDIEYLPSSWCGNSYHMVYLPKQTYWTFVAPRYEGKLKTRLRAALQYKESTDGTEQWVYSNAVEGSINAGQLTNMPKYSPNGIMDPYDN